MITENNLISILFQIGFYEMEDHEITFSSFEEKLAYRKGDKRYFKNCNSTFYIDYILRIISYQFVPKDKNKYTHGMNLKLDNMEDIFKVLNRDFNQELRILKIKKILE